MINSKDAGARSQESENGQADVAAKGDRFGQESLDADRELSSLRLRKIFTLIFIHDKEHGQLLLGQKQRGALLGQWNGFGGKVEPGIETVAESAARELKEEAFLTAPLFPIGFIQWVVSSPGEVTYRDVMVVYKAHSCNLADPSTTSSQNAPATPISGSSSTPYPTDMDQSQKAPERITEFKASDEMAPAWWDIDMLPWKAMRVNHRVWYPFMLADRPYKGVYWYQMTRAVAAEGTHNAQRETAQEIWVEDVEKRRFEFGIRPIGISGDDEVADDLQTFADHIGVSGPWYSSKVGIEGEQANGKQMETGPTPNKLIDADWLLAAIAKAEQDWEP